MPPMVDLKSWLHEQGLSVRELVSQLETPLKTVEDWVYRGAVPSTHNNEWLNEFIGAECTHHWVSLTVSEHSKKADDFRNTTACSGCGQPGGWGSLGGIHRGCGPGPGPASR